MITEKPEYLKGINIGGVMKFTSIDEVSVNNMNPTQKILFIDNKLNKYGS